MNWKLCAPWLGVVCLSGITMAAAQTPAPATPRQRLDDVCRRLAVRERITLFVDPEIRPVRPPALPASGRAVERSLDELCARLPDTAWRRLYVERAARSRLLPVRLAAVVRQTARVEQPQLEIRRSTSRVIRFRSDEQATALPETLRLAALDPEPVYLLYSTTATADGLPPEARLRALQAQQMALAGKEEHQSRAMVRIFQALRNVPMNTLESALAGMHTAGMRAWESTPPEQRQQIMRESFPTIQRLIDRAAGGDRPLPPPAPQDYGPDLQRILRELSRRFGVPYLSEPELLVPERPVLPTDAQEAAEALDRLAADLPGTDWREISLSEASWKRLVRPGALRRLADAVRFLDGLEHRNLAIEDPAARRFVSVRSTPVKQGKEDSGRDPSLRRFFLLYSLTPAAARGTLDERLAHLQDREFDLLGKMSPAELTSAMEGLVRQYGDADDGSRRRIIGLPLTAMLLGMWFPRDAKERGAGGMQ